MALGGALGVILARGYVNSAMSMLLSMLGVAGMMLLMKAYFIAFIMVSVYAGAVLVLFVFVVMLMGEERDGAGFFKNLAPTLLADADSAKLAAADSVSALASVKNYGLALFTQFMLPLQICGALLLAAMLGVIVIAKPSRGRAE